MTICGRCGSLQLVKGEPTSIDDVVRKLTGRRPFVCRRCGWRSRQDWTDAALAEAHRRLQANEAETDPSLADLDLRSTRETKRPGRSRSSTPGSFDLGFDDAAALAEADNPPAPHAADTPARLTQRPTASRRPNRSRRREIIRTIAVTGGVMIVVALLSLVGSCQPTPPP